MVGALGRRCPSVHPLLVFDTDWTNFHTFFSKDWKSKKIAFSVGQGAGQVVLKKIIFLKIEKKENYFS